jgi:hypothetical protein
MYDQLTGTSSGDSFSGIWKVKIPYKVKIFMWLVIRRKWMGDPLCQFCKEPETINHLFFECVVAKVIWGLWHSALAPAIFHQV